MESVNVSAIISAIAGLAGVMVGAFLTYLKERRTERIKDQKDGSYLAIIVVSHLDRFTNGCWSVAFDDGTSEGSPAGGNGIHKTTVEAPAFRPLEIEVEWRSLPQELMYDILQIPDKQDHLENILANPGFDDPPYYGEFFWTRRRDYAQLGLHVSRVTKRLRKHARMPIVEGPPGENREVSLQEIINEVDNERAKWERHQRIAIWQPGSV
jgi:hypothetical protein